MLSAQVSKMYGDLGVYVSHTKKKPRWSVILHRGLVALVGQFAVGRERHVEASVSVLALDQLFRLLAIVLRPEALVESIVEEDVSFGLHARLEARCLRP